MVTEHYKSQLKHRIDTTRMLFFLNCRRIKLCADAGKAPPTWLLQQTQQLDKELLEFDKTSKKYE